MWKKKAGTMLRISIPLVFICLLLMSGEQALCTEEENTLQVYGSQKHAPDDEVLNWWFMLGKNQPDFVAVFLYDFLARHEGNFRPHASHTLSVKEDAEKLGLTPAQIATFNRKIESTIQTSKSQDQRTYERVLKKLVADSGFDSENTSIEFILRETGRETFVDLTVELWTGNTPNSFRAVESKKFTDVMPLETFQRAIKANDDSHKNRRKVLGEAKYKLLKEAMDEEKFADLIGSFAGKLGVTIYASPKIRELLKISKSTAKSLDRTIATKRAQADQKYIEWEELLQETIDEVRLRRFVSDFEKWQIDSQHELADELTSSQQTTIRRWLSQSSSRDFSALRWQAQERLEEISEILTLIEPSRKKLLCNWSLEENENSRLYCEIADSLRPSDSAFMQKCKQFGISVNDVRKLHRQMDKVTVEHYTQHVEDFVQTCEQLIKDSEFESAKTDVTFRIQSSEGVDSANAICELHENSSGANMGGRAVVDSRQFENAIDVDDYYQVLEWIDYWQRTGQSHRGEVAFDSLKKMLPTKQFVELVGPAAGKMGVQAYASDEVRDLLELTDRQRQGIDRVLEQIREQLAVRQKKWNKLHNGLSVDDIEDLQKFHDKVVDWKIEQEKKLASTLTDEQREILIHWFEQANCKNVGRAMYYRNDFLHNFAARNTLRSRAAKTRVHYFKTDGWQRNGLPFSVK